MTEPGSVRRRHRDRSATTARPWAAVTTVAVLLVTACSATIPGSAYRGGVSAPPSSLSAHDAASGTAPSDATPPAGGPRPTAGDNPETDSSPASGNNPSPEATPADLLTAEPYVVKGRVTKADGTPLPGATVLASNTLAYNSNAPAVSGADGSYRIELPRSEAWTWRVYAGYDTTFDGRRFHVDLAVDDTPFGSAQGAVRDATWQLTGPRTDNPLVVYGGRAYFYEDVNRNDLHGGFYRVFFAPGELIDGSGMEPFVAESGVGEDWIDDLPLGRYEVVVAYIFTDERPAVQLAVRPRDTGDYAQSAAGSFRADTSQPLMEFDVAVP